MNILFIDDDELFNKIAALTLQQYGFNAQVRACNSVDKALSFLEGLVKEESRLFPSLIFLDINMPEKDGWDFLNTYRGFPTEVKEKVQLYMLSSSIYESDVIKSQQYEEVRDFIHKPLSKRDLDVIQFRLESQKR